MVSYLDVAFEVPWFFMAGVLVITVSLIHSISKKLNRLTPKWHLILLISFSFIVVCSCLSYSYLKQQEIKRLIVAGKVVKLQGVIDMVDEYNGKSIFTIEGSIFEIKHDNLYCVSGKHLIKTNEHVFISYVDLNGFLGVIQGKCILEIQSDLNH